MKWPKLIAHRGASASAPENTLIAFKMAKELGADWIECDVTLTQDDIPVIFHDKTFKRLANRNMNINQLDYQTVMDIDVGAWFSKKFSGEKTPTLEALLLFAKKHAIKINLELKPNGYKPKYLIKKIQLLLDETQFKFEDLLISSFDTKSLLYAQNYLPQVKRGLLLDKWRRNWHYLAEKFQVSSIHCHYKLCSKVRVIKIKQANYKLYCYTVNNKIKAEKLFAKGVDGIFSDYPDLLNDT